MMMEHDEMTCWERVAGCGVNANRALGFLAMVVLAVAFNATVSLAQGSPSGPASVPATQTSGSSIGAKDTAGVVASAQADAAHLDHVALLHLIDSIEPYYPNRDVHGSAVLSGSTTMLGLAKAWSDRFRQFHPNVTFTRGKDGSEAAIQDISDNPEVIAGSSRPLTDKELQSLKSSKCKEPLSIIVALDPLALYVHPKNPIASVTPEQLESIFRAPGSDKPHASTWGDLGVTGDWKDQPIRIHSRSDISGTTGFIRDWVIQGATLARSAEVHDSNDKVCAGVAGDPYGIGISGFGQATPNVKAVPLLIRGVTVPANETSFLAGKYPFVRPLVLIIDKSMMAQDGGVREAILRYVLSRDGQLEAVRAGFYPIDPSFIRKQLDSISGPQVR